MNFLKLAKSAPALVLTCALGIGLTQAAHYFTPASKGFTVTKGFTFEEARSLLHKRVHDSQRSYHLRYNLPECQTCIEDEMTTGRTISFSKQNGQYYIAIDWDVSFRGKHEVISYDKENYEKFIIETGPSED